MKKNKKIITLTAAILLLSLGVGSAFAAVQYTSHVTGLVFIDTNQNGVWDAGEEGYGGELQWVEDEGVTRYVGTTVTVMTPAYDEYDLETASADTNSLPPTR